MADLSLLWKNTVSEVEVDLGKTQTTLHFKNTSLLSLENNVATITAPNQAIKDSLEKKYYTLIQNALQRQSGQKLSLLFEITKLEAKTSPGPLFENETSPQSVLPDPVPFADDLYRKTGLNPRYTFKSLVVGSSNNFAHAAAETISKNPGREYNPFFIYGGVGVGKTHLMQAIGNELFSQNPNLKIIYFSAETFMNDLVASIQEKTMPRFKKKYRDVDVLLVDDVQFISGKESSQEEFFHTFNALYMAEKPIILTSDRPPEQIKVEDRLVSRLMSGLAADIQPPDLEMRMAIINEKLKMRGEKWDTDVVEYLAARFENNVREIEGAIQRIFVQARTVNIPVDLSLVRAALDGQKGHQINQSPAFIDPKKVIATVSKITGVKQADILSESRNARFVLPRQIIMYLLKTEQHMVLEDIAALLNRKDHTTVIHAVDKIKGAFAQNPRIKEQILLIKRELWG